MVHRILQLFRKSSYLEPLFLKHVTESDDFLLEAGHLISFRFGQLDLTFELADFKSEQLNVLKPLAVLHLAPSNDLLKNLDFLIKQADLVTSADHLRAKSVSLDSDTGQELSCVLMLAQCLRYDRFHALHLGFLSSGLVLCLNPQLRLLLQLFLVNLHISGQDLILILLMNQCLLILVLLSF